MFIKIYNTLIRLFYPLVISRYIKKRKKRGKEDTKRFNERMGKPKLKRPEGKLFWFHGASVGESISMLPLINKMLETYPNAHVMVTTGTTTSAEIMGKRLPERAFHQYLPIDNPVFATRFLRHWQPTAVLWFESDFWPAMISGIKRKKIPLILVNGRISNKSFKRWKQFDYIIKEILDCFTFCLGQTEEDAYRLKVLGAKDSMCFGNLKYAGAPLPIDKDKKEVIVKETDNRTLWLASSTHEDEEMKIARFHNDIKKEFPDLLLICAPRHPQRGADLQERMKKEYGLNVSLRSKGEAISKQTDVYIADTIGELGLWYDICPIVFIGGSLIPHGGQNFIEPSRQKDAVIVGPHMHNFTDAVNRAKKADAVIQVNDVLELNDAVKQLLRNKELLEAKRSLAFNWAESESKVLDGIISKIKGYLPNEDA